MKTKELIRLLQEEDPTGEVEVCVQNADIQELHTEPAYWDGKLQLLVRDAAKAPYYDVVGGKYVVKGTKVVITPYSITDMLWSDPDATVDYSELGESAGRYQESDDKTRQASRDVRLRVELDAFYRWAKKKADAIRDAGEDIRYTSDSFYRKFLSPEDPVKELPPTYDEKNKCSWGASWDERRSAAWNETLEVYWRGGWGIRKKDGTGVEGE